MRELTARQRDFVAMCVIGGAIALTLVNGRALLLSLVAIAATVAFMSSARKVERAAEHQRAIDAWNQRRISAPPHQQPPFPVPPSRDGWSTFGIALAVIAAVAALALLALIVFVIVAFANFGSNKG